MDFQSFATIIGVLSGIFTLIGGVVGAYDRLHERTQGAHAAAAAAAVPAGLNPPPASTAAGPYPQPTGSVPPPGYRWPATPPPGAGTAPPRQGYSPPAGHWSNPPRPAMPYPQPYYGQQPARRSLLSRFHPPGSSRWFPYPVVLIGAATFFILSGIYNSATTGANASADPSSDPFLVFVSLIATFAYLGTIIYASVQAIRLRRWGWLVSILLLVAYGVAAFGILGPTTRPQPKPPASYGPYPPYPPRRV